MKQQNYVMAIDQSTSGTKAMLFGDNGTLLARCDKAHRQIVNENGFIEHDAQEIYHNTIDVVRRLISANPEAKARVAAVGISNQRETGLLWDKSGKPLYNAVVWQCARGAEICMALEAKGLDKEIKQKTGLRLSPYFTAAKFAWLIANVPAVQKALASDDLLAGTIDSWLIYRLTQQHCTDYSNACRTQLFNISTMQWDEALCQYFGVPQSILPKVCDSDACYGSSSFEDVFDKPVPICAVLGDSHAALFAEGCTKAGMGKATYGTGSSVMINTGGCPVWDDALSTSLAWRHRGETCYVLEGNINYAGAVLNWLCDDLQLIKAPQEAQAMAESISDTGGVYLVPAFSGLGAPYWQSEARAILCGMTRKTKREHIVRAAEESIAYQVADIVYAADNAGIKLQRLRADGGPTRDAFLMQFEADLLNIPLSASCIEELSGAGAAFMAGLTAGVYTQQKLENARTFTEYTPKLSAQQVQVLYKGWKNAVTLSF